MIDHPPSSDQTQVDVPLSAPHVLTPAELVDDAGEEDEQVLHEERHSRVSVLGVERLSFVVMNILAKEDVGLR